MYKHNTFTHALARSPLNNMGNGLTTQSLGIPDFGRAEAQYAAYLDALRACGLNVTLLPGDSAYPDGHFVEDTAVIYGDLAVITRPGAPERQSEPDAVAAALPHQNRVCITGEGTVDGGDVLFCADRVLIGLSKRTNHDGAQQLKAALQAYQSSLKVDFVSFSGPLHLKTGLTELAPGVLLRSPALLCDDRFRFAQTHEVPAAEAYATNLLPINGALLIIAGYPAVRELAARCYTQIVELEMSEFEKMDGSLTCLSIRYQS
jgi:dimethylargininase